MKNIISGELKKLAKSFKENNSTLYIVGGFVRNFLLKIPVSDIDICGSLMGEEVADVCRKLGFKTQIVNKKLGTILITTKNKESYEYTTFRKDNYEKGGAHSPISVEFVNDIKIDASRRDFTINALYYDIVEDKILDFYNGLKDIKNKIVKCIETPQVVFNSDGLRLLRLLRFADELNFKIHKNTFKTAKNMAFQLKDISGERKNKELKSLLVADKKYGKNNMLAINRFNELNLYQYLFNSFLKNFKIKNNALYRSFLKCDKSLRFEAFIILMLFNKNEFRVVDFNYVLYLLGAFFEDKTLKGNLDFNSIAKTYLVVQGLLIKKVDTRLSVQFNALTEKEKSLVKSFCSVAEIEVNILLMKQKNIPLSPQDLAITNQELLSCVDKKNISRIREILFMACVNEKLQNKKENLIEMAIDLNTHFKDKIHI